VNSLAKQYVDQILEIDAPISKNDLIRAFETGYDIGFLTSQIESLTKTMKETEVYDIEGDA
jgi:hypothetical protein